MAVLVIREPQKLAIAEVMLRRWIVESLRPGHPEVTSAGVADALQRGRERGYESPESLVTYCRLELELPGLADDPAQAWAREILDDPAITVPAERLLALTQALARGRGGPP